MPPDATSAVKWRTSILICFACIVEGSDMALLPSVYMSISKSLNATPTQLGYLTLGRALVQALSSPLSGIVGNVLDRPLVIASGATLWSVCTIGVSYSSSLMAACVFTSINGFGLALVIPCAQSLIADYYPADQRGRAFGAMQLTMAIGSMLGGLFATNMAQAMPWGIDGWRIAFRSVSMVGFMVAASVGLFAVDPRPRKPLWSTSSTKQGASTTDLMETLTGIFGNAQSGLAHILSLRTFHIIIAQGIVGTMPWNAITFLTLWLQLLGFTSLSASVLAATFTGGTSAGAFIGGYIGDLAARYNPNSGRIFTAQTSAILGLPFTYVLIRCLPKANLEEHVVMYAIVLLLFGICVSWCGAGCNSPIFAEIVPEHLRSLIYAFDRCFEGALAACATPLVGLIAERGFGYEGGIEEQVGTQVNAHNHENGVALGNSLVLCLTVPWGLCFLIYTALHWTYPRDKAVLKSNQEVSDLRYPEDIAVTHPADEDADADALLISGRTQQVREAITSRQLHGNE